eukprot:TRINITY_DN4735_c0_g1_i1.p1 TRINITY_DN4735_c0_g1~~TRINITY_DN4735_c0_g1_i1.p1  ORF type:complete len:957 (-),score=268.57 TRINITY_DN4735_c0_g1_i1:187-3057(-)
MDSSISSGDDFQLPPLQITWRDEVTDMFFEKQIGNFKVLSKLGQGKFGLVKAGEDLVNHLQVAIKLINKQTLSDMDRYSLKTEAEVMNYIKHKNVVNLFEVIENRDYICMVMEYAGGGELFDYVMRQTRLAEVEARKLFVQIIDAIGHCHERRVIHRDIKAENIFLDETLEIVKIGDWGFATVFKPGSTLETACGSLDYAAPEILSGKPHVGPEVDVWALGVLLYFMVCGWLPFRAATDFDVYSKIKKGDFRALPSNISDELKNLIQLIFTTDPLKRPGIAQLKQHSWCAKAVADPEHLKRPKLPRLLQLQIKQHYHTRRRSDPLLGGTNDDDDSKVPIAVKQQQQLAAQQQKLEEEKQQQLQARKQRVLAQVDKAKNSRKHHHHHSRSKSEAETSSSTSSTSTLPDSSTSTSESKEHRKHTKRKKVVGGSSSRSSNPSIKRKKTKRHILSEEDEEEEQQEDPTTNNNLLLPEEETPDNNNHNNENNQHQTNNSVTQRSKTPPKTASSTSSSTSLDTDPKETSNTPLHVPLGASKKIQDIHDEVIDKKGLVAEDESNQRRGRRPSLSGASLPSVTSPQQRLSLNTNIMKIIPPLSVSSITSPRKRASQELPLSSRKGRSSQRNSNFSILRVNDEALKSLKEVKDVEILNVEQTERGEHIVLVAARTERGQESKVMEMLSKFETNSTRLKRSKSFERTKDKKKSTRHQRGSIFVADPQKVLLEGSIGSNSESSGGSSDSHNQQGSNGKENNAVNHLRHDQDDDSPPSTPTNATTVPRKPATMPTVRKRRTQTWNPREFAKFNEDKDLLQKAMEQEEKESDRTTTTTTATTTSSSSSTVNTKQNSYNHNVVVDSTYTTSDNSISETENTTTSTIPENSSPGGDRRSNSSSPTRANDRDKKKMMKVKVVGNINSSVAASTTTNTPPTSTPSDSQSSSPSKNTPVDDEVRDRSNVQEDPI